MSDLLLPALIAIAPAVGSRGAVCRCGATRPRPATPPARVKSSDRSTGRLSAGAAGLEGFRQLSASGEIQNQRRHLWSHPHRECAAV